MNLPELERLLADNQRLREKLATEEHLLALQRTDLCEKLAAAEAERDTITKAAFNSAETPLCNREKFIKLYPIKPLVFTDRDDYWGADSPWGKLLIDKQTNRLIELIERVTSWSMESREEAEKWANARNTARLLEALEGSQRGSSRTENGRQKKK